MTRLGWILLLLWASLAGLAGCASLPTDVQRPLSQAIPAAPTSALARMVQASTPDPTKSGVRLMSYSAQALDTRIEMARRAQHSLDVQYYVIHNDETGRYLLRSLRDAALRGVRVRLLIDDLYTAGSDPLLRSLAAYPNIELRLFNPFVSRRHTLAGRLFSTLHDLGRINHRMHNKLYIADGVMAVAGGRNIGNEYFMVHEGSNYIDLDAFVVGAVVPALQTLFDEYWNSPFVYPIQALVHSTQAAAELQRQFEALTTAALAPKPVSPTRGSKDLLGYVTLSEEMETGRLNLIWADAEAFADAPAKVMNHTRRWLPGPRREEVSVRKSLMDELLLARDEVLVSSPYMVPDRYVMEDIREGRIWGLRITIITNSLASTDEPLVHAGYQRYRREMLDLGVELYEVVPSQVRRSDQLGPFGQSIGRFHAKAAAIDGKVLFIGSLNFDPRSEKHNTELGLIIRSAPLTGQLLRLAEVVKLQAAYRVRLNRVTQGLEWSIKTAAGEQTLHEEPDTSFWQRTFLRLIAPFVPDELL